MGDHVEPHRRPAAFVTGKLQSLCEPCHKSAKREIELRGYRCDVGFDGLPTNPNQTPSIEENPELLQKVVLNNALWERVLTAK